MTSAQLEHLRLLDAHLTALLDLAAKRTPGEWRRCRYEPNRIKQPNGDGIGYSLLRDTSGDISNENTSFIASCAGNAEAGWRSTKIALKLLKDFITSPLTAGIERQCAQATLETILAEWPIELIKRN